MHWHGILQTDTPWFDGVPGVAQCPITPGASFTYRFRADLYGTTWYHSHYSAQYSSGLYGPLVIYGPSDNTHYDEDLGPVLLTDWSHEGYFALVEQTMSPTGFPPVLSQNSLINGKMNYPCANATGYTCTPNAGVSKFQFTSGKIYRLRLVNTGAEGMLKFSIDNHQMTVIANDFVPLIPYEVNVVTLGVGQRTDIVVKATGGPTDAVWMRSTLGPSALTGPGCTLNDGVSPEAVAAIYYQDANNNIVPDTTTSVTQAEILTCTNDPLSETIPYYSITPPKPETTITLDVTRRSNGTHELFFVNNSTFRADYNDPVLIDAKNGQTTFPDEYNVYDLGQSTSIRLIMYNYAAQTTSHPMHIHGHNMYVLAVGTGTWDGTITNRQNPQRRDVQLLEATQSATVPNYMVVQVRQNSLSSH